MGENQSKIISLFAKRLMGVPNSAREERPPARVKLGFFFNISSGRTDVTEDTPAR